MKVLIEKLRATWVVIGVGYFDFGSGDVSSNLTGAPQWVPSSNGKDTKTYRPERSLAKRA